MVVAVQHCLFMGMHCFLYLLYCLKLPTFMCSDKTQNPHRSTVEQNPKDSASIQDENSMCWHKNQALWSQPIGHEAIRHPCVHTCWLLSPEPNGCGWLLGIHTVSLSHLLGLGDSSLEDGQFIRARGPCSCMLAKHTWAFTVSTWMWPNFTVPKVYTTLEDLYRVYWSTGRLWAPPRVQFCPYRFERFLPLFEPSTKVLCLSRHSVQTEAYWVSPNARGFGDTGL